MEDPPLVTAELNIFETSNVSPEKAVDRSGEKSHEDTDRKDDSKIEESTKSVEQVSAVKVEAEKVDLIIDSACGEKIFTEDLENKSDIFEAACILNPEKNSNTDAEKGGGDDVIVLGTQNTKTDSELSSRSQDADRAEAESIEKEIYEPPRKKNKLETDSVISISHGIYSGETEVVEIVGPTAKRTTLEIEIDPMPGNTELNIIGSDIDTEIPGSLDKSNKLLDTKSNNEVVQTKDETEVILIDETNTDSRGSAETDDDVIIVDETLKESTAGGAQASTSQDSLLYDFSHTPRLLTGAWKCFQSKYNDNYLRGCKWAPDGTCLLSNSNDNCLRLFNLPQEMYMEGGENQNIAEMEPVLKMKEADTIYDYCWYPQMSSANPDTACLAVTSKDTPIHLYDAFTGELRCSYRAFNHVDEVAPAYSLSFSPEGSKLYCGFNKMVRVFDVMRPGREFENRPTFAKQGQPGIISCIAHSPTESGLYAAGSYSRTIALYQEPTGEMICMFQGQQGGVTHLAFSPDGSKLYSGGRKDPEILCWDMRNPGQILYTLIRKVETNQRIYFDQTLDGRYLVSGSHDSSVLIWDTHQPPSMLLPDSDPVLKPVSIFSAHNDTVNGVSLHPSLPLVATSSGRRHFPDMYDSSDSDIENSDNDNVVDNSLKLWWV